MPPSGFVRPTDSPTLTLEEGKQVQHAIRLDRAGVITGRVIDEAGEPAVGLQVRAWRRSDVGPSRGWFPAGTSATANDLGQYRLFDLPADRYIVSASAPPRAFAVGTGPRSGYAPTYHPGVSAASGASPVPVRAGQETPGVDIVLQPALLGRVSGVVTDSAGRPPSTGASVSIRPRDFPGAVGSRGASVQPDGNYVIADVPPGDYFIEASLRPGEQQALPREAAYLPITINGDDLQVNLRTNTGATITGRVEIEGAAQPFSTWVSGEGRGGRAPCNVQVIRADSSAMSAMTAAQSPVTPREDGTFELSGIRGAVRLTAMAFPLVLESITIRGEDVTGTVLEFAGTERIEDVVVTLTTEVATIDGTVTTAQGTPADRASVIVFPDQPALWFTGSPFVRIIGVVPPPAAPIVPAQRPAPAAAAPMLMRRLGPGGFAIGNLRPGRYLIVALEWSDRVPLPSPEWFGQLRPIATSIVLTAGQTTSVQLRLAKRP